MMQCNGAKSPANIFCPEWIQFVFKEERSSAMQFISISFIGAGIFPAALSQDYLTLDLSSDNNILPSFWSVFLWSIHFKQRLLICIGCEKSI